VVVAEVVTAERAVTKVEEKAEEQAEDKTEAEEKAEDKTVAERADGLGDRKRKFKGHQGRRSQLGLFPSHRQTRHIRLSLRKLVRLVFKIIV
jgi:hypothetical protein